MHTEKYRKAWEVAARINQNNHDLKVLVEMASPEAIRIFRGMITEEENKEFNKYLLQLVPEPVIKNSTKATTEEKIIQKIHDLIRQCNEQ